MAQSTAPSTGETQPGIVYHTSATVGSLQGSSHSLTPRSESMLKGSSTSPDGIRPTTTPTHLLTQTAPPPGPSWLAGSGYPQPGAPAFREIRHPSLMGNKHGATATPGENVRGHHLPPTSSGLSAEQELTERTRVVKEESGLLTGGGGGSASTASSGIGSESPEKNSPGVVRGGSDTAEWLAQIGTGQLHHGRNVVSVGVTLPSEVITLSSLAVPTTEPKHYYSTKDVVYASTPVNPASLTQYSAPSTVHLTTVPSYSPYLSPYGLPYIGYPAAQSALTPGIESYSAMLASMGNQVQQAQAHLPSSPFLTPGIAIPSPYAPLGIPAGITPAAKGSPLSDSAGSPVAYIGGHVIPTPSLLPTSHSLQTGVIPSAAVAGMAGSHIPAVSIKTEDNRQDLSQSKNLEQERHEQELKRYMDMNVKHGGIREARVSPFERRTSSPLGKEHIRTGRDSGVPESPRQSMELSPSAVKIDSSRQQYYREIGLGSMKTEPGRNGQTYLTSPRPDVHMYKEHSQSSEGIRTHTSIKKSSVISRTPSIVSPIPSTIHMTSRISSAGQSRQSPQSGLVLSPTPQVRSTPSVSTRTHPTVTATHQQGAAIQVEFPSPGGQVKVESHRFVQDTQEQRHRGAGEASGQSTLTNVPSYFTRGSIIQLANGELRRVEDLRTEDFVQSADLTEGLKIDSSTVLKVEVDHGRGVAHIGFLVGEQKAQVTVEAPMEHPFFVFGQGWSAVQPDRSLKSYALACHPLAVGDVCVSLTVKENGRQPPLKKERVLENLHIGRDIVKEPDAKRIRTDGSVWQLPIEKAPPLAQSAYHRQTTEGALSSNHIPGYPGLHHSSYTTESGSSSAVEHPHSLAKISEIVDVDKNANTVFVQASMQSSSSKHIPPPTTTKDQQIARPLKRRWSDPVKAAEPSSQAESLPAPVHPDMLMKQSGGH